MKVYFIGAGPGDPELLTLKADRILRGCRCCIYAGSLINPEIVERLPEDAERYDSAKMDLPEIIKIIEQARTQGNDVVRLHSGDPSIYGAIREQMNELDLLGIAYEVVPGVSSFQAGGPALPTGITTVAAPGPPPSCRWATSYRWFSSPTLTLEVGASRPTTSQVEGAGATP